MSETLRVTRDLYFLRYRYGGNYAESFLGWHNENPQNEMPIQYMSPAIEKAIVASFSSATFDPEYRWIKLSDADLVMLRMMLAK